MSTPKASHVYRLQNNNNNKYCSIDPVWLASKGVSTEFGSITRTLSDSQIRPFCSQWFVESVPGPTAAFSLRTLSAAKLYLTSVKEGPNQSILGDDSQVLASMQDNDPDKKTRSQWSVDPVQGEEDSFRLKNNHTQWFLTVGEEGLLVTKPKADDGQIWKFERHSLTPAEAEGLVNNDAKFKDGQAKGFLKEPSLYLRATSGLIQEIYRAANIGDITRHVGRFDNNDLTNLMKVEVAKYVDTNLKLEMAITILFGVAYFPGTSVFNYYFSSADNVLSWFAPQSGGEAEMKFTGGFGLY